MQQIINALQEILDNYKATNEVLDVELLFPKQVEYQDDAMYILIADGSAVLPDTWWTVVASGCPGTFSHYVRKSDEEEIEEIKELTEERNNVR